MNEKKIRIFNLQGIEIKCSENIYFEKKILILYAYVVTYRVTGDGAIILLHGKLVKSCH